MKNPIEIEYLGGAGGEVTGSSMLVTFADHKGPPTRVLMDHGLQMGHNPEIYRANHTEFVSRQGKSLAPSITGAVLSHPHVDHSGRFPNLVGKGYKGPIFATPETVSLAEAMLLDTAKISQATFKEVRKVLKEGMRRQKPFTHGRGQRDIIKEKHHTRENGHGTLPLPISYEDVEQTLRQLHPVELDRPFKIDRHATGTFHNAGHTLGSATSRLDLGTGSKKVSIFCTHDLGNEQKRSYLGAPHVPTDPVDILSTEATYGNREHTDLTSALSEMREKIISTLKGGGRVIIPAFALERTQEILMYLNNVIDQINQELGLTIPVYVDSPLAHNITETYNKILNNGYLVRFGGENPLAILQYKGFKFLNNEDRIPALYNGHQGPAIIISSSGMCDAGPVREHLVRSLSQPENLILFVGFTGIDTLASRILHAGSGNTPGQVRIHKDVVPVRSSVYYTSAFSAHADSLGLLDFASQIPYKGHDRSHFVVFIHHCSQQSGISFREALLNELHDLREENVILAQQGIVYPVNYIKA